ncbi:MAG: cytochrome c5 family protein [Gammaproteobacteria bacterium]|nr:cytochrome c5 family protein [Gammaproteobacteria bacterium]
MSVLLMVLASAAASDVNQRLDERSAVENTTALAERLAPVGQFAANTVAAAAPVAAAPKSADEVYNTSCAACHASGVAGAPMIGDADAWSARMGKGSDALYANAVNGYVGEAGVMPAKGGNVALSDDEVKAAVDYMLEQL